MAKTHPEKVEPTLARLAIADANQQRMAIWSRYLIRCYRVTGSLAPGCNARDLYAWLDAQPEVPGWCKSAKARQDG